MVLDRGISGNTVARDLLADRNGARGERADRQDPVSLRQRRAGRGTDVAARRSIPDVIDPNTARRATLLAYNVAGIAFALVKIPPMAI